MMTCPTPWQDLLRSVGCTADEIAAYWHVMYGDKMRKDDDLENHLALPGPWGGNANDPAAPEPGRWECGCGHDHSYDVQKLGYPMWHSRHKFMEECAGANNECGRRCCHECAATCRICGCHYCPEHLGVFNLELNLCAGCGEHYAVFGATREAKEVDKLIEIERRRMTGYARAPLESEIAWLLEQLKEAWSAIAEAQ